VANVDDWEVESDDDDDAPSAGAGKKPAAAGKAAAAAGGGKKAGGRGIFSYLQGLTGTRAIEAGDLEPVLAKFREMLVEKNVAVDIAEKLCGRHGTDAPAAGRRSDAAGWRGVGACTPRRADHFLGSGHFGGDVGNGNGHGGVALSSASAHT
jgi:hypothetical protein